MWMDHLFSYDMNLEKWLSKFRLGRKQYRKELLVLDQEKTNGCSKNKNLGKLHITTLNYALDYTLHPKLSDCTLCTLNYHTYHVLHSDVIFAVIFNIILLHVTSTCFLLKWNKVKRLKQPSSNSIKTKPKFFPHLPLSHVVVRSVPLSAQIHQILY